VSTETTRRRGGLAKFWESLGPGLLFAATSVGVSHLVNSTRAGAIYGLGMFFVVILANLIKYPAFRFSSHYVGVTGHSLLAGYRKLSPAAVWFFIIAVSPLYFLGVTILSRIAAGLIIALFGVQISEPVLATALAVAGSAFVLFGRYHWLETFNKWLVVLLTIITVITTIIVLPQVPWSLYPDTAPPITLATVLFVVAVVGYMPSPMEVSVLHSLWSVAKRKEEHDQEDSRSNLRDFNIGYIGTIFLALCFLLMGAAVMHAQGIAPEANAVSFSAQLINLYSTALGPWAGFLAGTAALVTIVTSLLTVIDGGPRSIVAALRAGTGHGDVPDIKALDKTRGYVWCIIAVALVAVLFINVFDQAFTKFLDFGAGVSFTIGTVLAILNHVVVFGKDVPVEKRPGQGLRIWSLAAIVIMVVLSIVNIQQAFFAG